MRGYGLWVASNSELLTNSELENNHLRYYARILTEETMLVSRPETGNNWLSFLHDEDSEFLWTCTDMNLVTRHWLAGTCSIIIIKGCLFSVWDEPITGHEMFEEQGVRYITLTRQEAKDWILKDIKPARVFERIQK